MAKKTENKEEVIKQTEQKIIDLFGNKEIYNDYKKNLLKEIKKTKRENYFTLRCFIEKNTIQILPAIKYFLNTSMLVYLAVS